MKNLCWDNKINIFSNGFQLAIEIKNVHFCNTYNRDSIRFEGTRSCTEGPNRRTSAKQTGIIGRGLYCPFHCSLVREPLGITDSYFNRLIIPPVIRSNAETFNSCIFIKQIRRQLLRLRPYNWTTFSLLSVRNKCIGYYKIGNYSFRNSVLNFLTFYPKQDILYSLGKWKKNVLFQKETVFLSERKAQTS